MKSTNSLSAAAALFAAAALVAGAVAPATASPNDPTKQAKSETPTAKELQKRYCIQGPTTGTMLPKRVCHTRAEWIAQGFDPAKKKN